MNAPRGSQRAVRRGKPHLFGHSAGEMQAFYRRMGCVEAAEYDPRLAAQEPCDCQLEYRLKEVVKR